MEKGRERKRPVMVSLLEADKEYLVLCLCIAIGEDIRLRFSAIFILNALRCEHVRKNCNILDDFI